MTKTTTQTPTQTTTQMATQATMKTIRELFSTTRRLDRKIEKVIDYRATEETRLEQEISEYEVTPSVQRGMLRILEAFDEGVRTGNVTEIGVWVSGYYGSGKSSFTKYLGFALDKNRKLGGAPFVERLAERIPDPSAGQRLRAVARQHRTAIFMIDLGTDQLADSSSESVANVLYWNVLKELGFSKERKVAELELRLERDEKLDAFKQAYAVQYPGKEPWDVIHNDPSLAVVRASTLLSKFYPDDYKDPAIFRQTDAKPLHSVGDLARKMIELIKRHKQCDNVIFFVDEVGQYVAPRQELILNLDGLARAFKEIGQGRVWFVATAQQTLEETSEKASLNSAELFKLNARFPIAIPLEATDILQITRRRLLTKNNEGKAQLEALFKQHGELLQLHSHLVDWPGGRTPLDGETFANLYPFLPARFQLVLDLIRALSRRTGGTGLRSAIRLVQDLLIGKNYTLPKGTLPLADREIGQLAAADDLYDTLRHDLHKDYPQAASGVDRIQKHPDFAEDVWAVRAAKAVAVLQPLEDYPRTAGNIAALLYRDLGAPGVAKEVAQALQRLVDAREFGLVELAADASAQGGAGFVFLSDEVQPVKRKRDSHEPPQADRNNVRLDVLRRTFDPLPEARAGGLKTVHAALWLHKTLIAGEAGDILFRLEEVEPGRLEARAEELAGASRVQDDYKNTVFWIFERPDDVDAQLVDVCRSTFIQGESTRGRDKTLPPEVARFLRSEVTRAERARDAVRASYTHRLLKGVFVFAGIRRAVEELGSTVSASASAFLEKVAADVFSKLTLVKKLVPADAATRFLDTTRLDQMPKDRDPLGLVDKKGGRTFINTGHPALEEALRSFRVLVAAAGSGRVQGAAVLEAFNAPPFGWSKDTTRYLFAALLMAGEIELYTGDGVLRTAGPRAVEALRNTQSFSRAGVAPRGQPVPMEALDRASRRLEEMFGVEVLPLEDQVSRVVRSQFPTVMERVGSLPDRLRLLDLPGKDRARTFLQTCADLLKEDAGGAASLLGSVESSIPGEVKWASGVVRMLNDDGEREIRDARDLIRRLRELADLFTVVEEILARDSVATITEILGSESFHQRIADLRGAATKLRSEVEALYKAERARLAAAIDEAAKRIEARPSWRRITEGERKVLGDELLAAAVPQTEPIDPVSGLQRVLTRRIGLADLEERLARRSDRGAEALEAAAAAEAARRAATEDSPALPEEAARVAQAKREVSAELVSMAELLPATALLTTGDVERWIDELRARLLERVQLGPIRLTLGTATRPATQVEPGERGER